MSKENNGFELRPYQQERIEQISGHLESISNPHIMAPLATGLGKTVMFCQMIKQMRKKALIIAHRDELLQQPRQTLISMGVPQHEIDIVKQSMPSTRKKIWIASRTKNVG